MRHLVRAVGPLVVAVLGVCLVVAGGYLALTTHAQVTPVETTEGELLGADAERIVESDPDPYGDQIDHVYYRIDATYRYEVDGETYTGERVARPGPLFVETQGAARAYVGDLRTADGVTVHYDPAAPGRAYLRAHYPVEWLFAHSVGWALLLGLVAVDAYGVATWGRNLIGGVPLVGAGTPLGTAGALPVYAAAWYGALVPWRWYLALGDPGGFGLVAPAAVGLLVLAWAGLQAHGWAFGGERAADDDAPPDPARPWVPGADSDLVDATPPGDPPRRDQPPAHVDPGGVDDDDGDIEYASWGDEDDG